jgi:hypothetical protein
MENKLLLQEFPHTRGWLQSSMLIHMTRQHFGVTAYKKKEVKLSAGQLDTFGT